MGKFRRKLYKTNEAHWYCKNLKERGFNPLRDEPRLKLEFYNYSDTVKWIRANKKEFPWIFNQKQIYSADKHSHYYPNLKADGKIVGLLKIGVKHVYIEDYEGEISLADDEAFIYDTFILPEYRRRYLGSFMLRCALNELETIGVLYIFCHIPKWNVSPIKLYRSLGFRPVAHIRYLRLMRFRFFSNNPDKVRENGRRLVAKSC